MVKGIVGIRVAFEREREGICPTVDLCMIKSGVLFGCTYVWIIFSWGILG